MNEQVWRVKESHVMLTFIHSKATGFVPMIHISNGIVAPLTHGIVDILLMGMFYPERGYF